MPTIREMKLEDLPRVAELSEQLGYPVKIDDVAERFSRIAREREQSLFVAVDPRGIVIGWIHVHGRWLLETEAYAEIAALVVDASSRRTGAGRALVARAEAWGREHGFLRLRLRSNVVREEAHHFYPALGFEKVKTQHTYQKRLG